MNMITKDYFEKQLKKQETLTVFAYDNVPHTIVKKYHITTAPDNRMRFKLDCKDLEDYCHRMGITLKPKK
jgi:hypothetical protein